MPLKSFTKFTILALCLSVSALAQTPPSQGTHITVSKNADDLAMYSTVQAAVNAAQPGQVIEILDTATYREQVTIDSTKYGITLRSKYPTDLVKPKIVWQDIINRSPNTVAEAKTQGDTVGSSGNFETCGALRIKRVHGVTIDGITVDGGGPAPFGSDEFVWGTAALVHGNAAITLVVAGGAVIRNCELRNAYIGLNVKDRNTGGVFGNPNPADNDQTIPLSGFGKTGNHLIEYNRIHDNSLGIFFESAWDLGSTVRYNLIYSNFHIESVLAWIKSVDGKFGSENNNLPACGAMMFKDMVYTPVAIYNNTFYNNKMNLIAHWKIGATHLLFNNIFGKSSVPVAANGGRQNGFNGVDHMAMDGAFPNRQYNSVMSAYIDIAAQGQKVYFDYNCNPQEYDTLWIRDITVWNNFASPEKARQDIFAPGCPVAHSENMVMSGALLTGGEAGFPSAANMRWLEMSKVSISTSPTGKALNLPDLFQSTDPTNPRFLWPDWNNPLVDSLIKNKGWEAAGIRNADGKIADIGAISSNNDIHQPTVVRIKPTGVVMITGTTTATARTTFMLTLESGTMTDPKIKLLRWISPIDSVSDNFGGSGANGVAIRASAIRNITPPTGTLSFGTNNFEVTLPSATTDRYGFFEVVVEGKDANGQTVVSDVGFLPYRKLEYTLVIEASKGGVAVKEVQAGEAVTLKVTAYKMGTPNTPYTTSVGTVKLPVEYTLFSGSTARMYEVAGDKALTYEPDLTTGSSYTKTYTVYFTKTGDETIQGAGIWSSGDKNLTFLGSLDIKVRPGVADKVVFLQPIPKSQLRREDGTYATPPTISGTYDVEVQVQDRYGNPIDTKVDVTMVSSEPDTGDVEVSPVSTDPADGIARFTAVVTKGTMGQKFDLYASISQGSKAKDTASLRVGRASDAMSVFYYESTPPKHGDSSGVNKGGYWMDDYTYETLIDAEINTWKPVWVKVRNTTGDTVVTNKSAFVCVTPSSPDIKFAADSGGAAAVGSYMATVTNGVAHFWITSSEEVNNVSLNVSAKATADCDGARDNSINDGNRGRITFFKVDPPPIYPDAAVLRGDGNGRPNTLLITVKSDDGTVDGFASGAWRLPDSVSLRWPGNCDGTRDVMSTAITYNGDTIKVTLPADMFPDGYSYSKTPATELVALVKIYNAITAGSGVSSPKTLSEQMGPLIAKDAGSPLCGFDATGNPRFPENKNRGVTPDTLRLQITEDLANPQSLKGNSLLMSREPAGPGVPLFVDSVLSVEGGVYTLVLSLADTLKHEYWIMLNPAHPGILDMNGNAPAADNRWVQIFESEQPPELKTSWYVTNDATGKADFAYLVFDKKVALPAGTAGWFVGGGGFEFSWEGIVRDTFVVDELNVAAVTFRPGAGALGDTIVVDLKIAFDNASNPANDIILTSGSMTITVKFAQAKRWPVAIGVASDRARPVLMSAALHMGGKSDEGVDELDTLIITYSEAMSDNLAGIKSPVSLLRQAGGGLAALDLAIIPGPGGITNTAGRTVVRYLTDAIILPGGAPQSGDSVKINEIAGVTDLVSNVQDNPVNRRVVLTVTPSKPKWQTKVKNNPFKDSTVIVMTPNAKGENLFVEAQIKLYDNMGKLVVDTLVINNPNFPVDRNNPNALQWTWRGRNRSGRFVGTGTYIMRSVCVAKTEKGIVVDVPQTVNRSIGFIRGKIQ